MESTKGLISFNSFGTKVSEMSNVKKLITYKWINWRDLKIKQILNAVYAPGSINFFLIIMHLKY